MVDAAPVTPQDTARPLWAALRGKCPRCGGGSLFQRVIVVRDACEHCGLDLRAHDAADGPAYVAMSIICALAAVMVAVLELKFHAAWWGFALGLLLLVCVGLPGLLRLAKAVFVAMQFRYRRDAFEASSPPRQSIDVRKQT